MTTIAISSGHGAKVAGACGIIREHEEAVRVVNQLAVELQHCGVNVYTFEDTVSTTQNENLNRIVDWHNSRQRDLDISVHFNAYEQVSKPMGCEVLYVTQAALANQLSAAIAEVGFINRGPKKRTDLFFLNNTAMPAVLLEVCFVDSEADCDIYAAEFKEICINLAEALGGDEGVVPPEPEPPSGDYLFETTGACSHFGGPDDMGVSASEGLAFHFEINPDNQHLFLPLVPAGTSGLARRLNAKAVHYIACRWDYAVTPKSMLATDLMALVTNPRTGRSTCAYPADWGPNEATDRVADLSPALMEDLDLQTDDVVEVVYPWMGD
jgi:N-acetylmuramoyl-L-alanine amidase